MLQGEPKWSTCKVIPREAIPRRWRVAEADSARSEQRAEPQRRKLGADHTVLAA